MRRLAQILVVTGALCAGPAGARDFLDTLGGHGWSPDSKWVGFNPVGQNSLFFIAPRSGKTYMIRPVGTDIPLTGGLVFSDNPPPKTLYRSSEGTTLVIPSPGKSKLEIVEWSPDSKVVAYAADRKTRFLFSLFEETITNRIAATEMLPWQSERDVHVTFELAAATKDRPARYWLRVLRPNDTVVKEISFDDPKEIRQLNLLRFSGTSFLSPDNQFLVYPKLRPKGWQLVLEPVWSKQAPRSVTEPTTDPPLEWRLAPDGRYIAVVETPYSLAVGAVDNWDRAEKVPLPNITPALRWSADGRFLACNAREQLYLLVRGASEDRIVSDFVLVSNFCAPTFWGWRGTKLLFSDFRSGSTNVYMVDAERPGPPVPLVKPRDWQSAPRERTISPDGSMFVCLMMEQDSEGRLTPQVWKVDLRSGAEWQKLYTFKPVP